MKKKKKKKKKERSKSKVMRARLFAYLVSVENTINEEQKKLRDNFGMVGIGVSGRVESLSVLTMGLQSRSRGGRNKDSLVLLQPKIQRKYR